MRNPISLELIQLLDTIDKNGSLNAAARALYKVPSAISYTIKKLEQELDVKLFIKKGRRNIMTPAARILLDQGKEILISVDELQKNIMTIKNGFEAKLNIAIDSILSIDVLHLILKKFYKVYPHVEINLFEEVMNGAWESVIFNRADLVIGASNLPIENQEIAFKCFQSITWAFTVSSHHPLTTYSLPLRMEDIEKYRFIIVRDSAHHLTHLSARIFSKLPVLSVPTIRDKINAISNGLGVGFLPEIRVKEAVQRKQIVTLPIQRQVEKSSLYLAWKKQNKGKLLHWFIDEMKAL